MTPTSMPLAARLRTAAIVPPAVPDARITDWPFPDEADSIPPALLPDETPAAVRPMAEQDSGFLKADLTLIKLCGSGRARLRTLRTTGGRVGTSKRSADRRGNFIPPARMSSDSKSQRFESPRARHSTPEH